MLTATQNIDLPRIGQRAQQILRVLERGEVPSDQLSLLALLMIAYGMTLENSVEDRLAVIIATLMQVHEVALLNGDQR